MTILALVAPLLLPQLRSVALVGAPRVRFNAARRRSDRRDTVLALVNSFRVVAADAFA